MSQRTNIDEPIYHALKLPISEVDFQQTYANKLGHGGFATVFKGKYKEDTVAVKCLTTTCEIEITSENIKDFLREAVLLRNLKHRNIVHMCGILYEPEKPFHGIVLEYMEYGSLANFLSIVNPCIEIKISFLRDVLTALAWIHSRQNATDATYPHGDIKCANILLNSEFVAKLSDFGGARKKRWNTLSQNGFYLSYNKQFTPAYSAPELFDNSDEDDSDSEDDNDEDEERIGKTNEKSDIWAYGVAKFVILSGGKLPFKEKIKPQQILCIAQKCTNLFSNAQLQKIPSTYPETLVQVMKNCCERDPNKRPNFSKMKEFMDAEFQKTSESVHFNLLKNLREEYKLENERQKQEDENPTTNPEIDQNKSNRNNTNQTLTNPNEADIRKLTITNQSAILPQYDLQNSNKPIALIINNLHFASMPPREGSALDVLRLEILFQYLGFETIIYTDLIVDEIMQHAKDFCKMCENNDVPASALVIMTHGHEQGLMGIDEKYIAINDILKVFDSSVYPYNLNNKPKLFFIQACRGTGQRERYFDNFKRQIWKQQNLKATIQNSEISHSNPTENLTSSDACVIPKDTECSNKVEFKPQEKEMAQESSTGICLSLCDIEPELIAPKADMLMYYATVPGHKSYRNTIHGSWFIEKIYQIFLQNAKLLPLNDMITLANNKISGYRSKWDNTIIQMPQLESTLRKSLYFNVEKDVNIPKDCDIIDMAEQLNIEIPEKLQNTIKELKQESLSCLNDSLMNENVILESKEMTHLKENGNDSLINENIILESKEMTHLKENGEVLNQDEVLIDSIRNSQKFTQINESITLNIDKPTNLKKSEIINNNLESGATYTHVKDTCMDMHIDGKPVIIVRDMLHLQNSDEYCVYVDLL